jgi:hypothetical protein
MIHFVVFGCVPRKEGPSEEMRYETWLTPTVDLQATSSPSFWSILLYVVFVSKDWIQNTPGGKNVCIMHVGRRLEGLAIWDQRVPFHPWKVLGSIPSVYLGVEEQDALTPATWYLLTCIHFGWWMTWIFLRGNQCSSYLILSDVACLKASAEYMNTIYYCYS